MGRLYLYRAEVLGELARHKEALESVEYAIELGCDRVHIAHGVKGDVLMELGASGEAVAAYQQAIREKDTFVPAYKSLINALKDMGDDSAALKLIDTAMMLHPSANLVREKAFLLSNNKADDEAIAILDAAILDPPHEETEAVAEAGNTATAILRKAKVAVLADLSRFQEAAEELTYILEADTEDEEAVAMKTDIFVALARDHAAKYGKQCTAYVFFFFLK